MNPGTMEDSPELIKSLDLEILAQPDDHTCGPTCLHAVYRYYDRTLPLEQVINEAESLEGGGTLAVMLGHHALSRGFSARIYTYNMQVFDPTWFGSTPEFLVEKLVAQSKLKSGKRLQLASRAYLKFLRLGGEIRFEDMRASLLRKYLKKGVPILTGLSATYLYRTPREKQTGTRVDYDDLAGEPSGHFVVLAGYDKETRRVQVADPLKENPMGEGQTYWVDIDRLICAIMLGILTYDANLLILQPPTE